MTSFLFGFLYKCIGLISGVFNPHPTACQTHQFSHTHSYVETTLYLFFRCCSLSLFAFHTLPHLLQHMPTHTAPQAHVIWNCIFPSFSLLSLSCPSHLALLSVSHTCAGTLKTRFPFEMSLQLSPSSGPLSLLFIPSAIQIKTMLYCLDWEETCAAHFISWPILFY